MRSLRQICAVVALTLALSIPALAGDVQFPGVTAPPQPPPDSIVCEVDCPETVPTGATGTSDDPLTEITLCMVQGVMSLF